MEVIDGKIILGIEDAPLVDALAAWTDRVKARIAADALQQKTKSAQPPPLSDRGNSLQ